MIFTFGIGSSVNKQLLTLIATQNNGLSQFLGAEELENVITDFYLQIRNPVLLDTQLFFDPNVLTEVYPNPLPNLFKGQQMILVGRYNEAAPVKLTLDGKAFGNSVEYNYNISLSDSTIQNYQFLPKIWAKKKIEHLLVKYYSLNISSPEAADLKDKIIELSIAYNVITEFTSFTGGYTSVEDELGQSNSISPKDFRLLGNYPNPFNPSTTIRIEILNDIYQSINVNIYNTLGQLVKVLNLNVTGRGFYEINWDGLLDDGNIAKSGVYIYTIQINNTVYANKMMVLK